MRKLLLFVSYFTITPCVLLASILLLAWISYTQKGNNIFSFNTQQPSVVYTAVPSDVGQVAISVTEDDARVTKLTRFLHAYHSALEQYAGDIVTAADTYNLDYRLVPAIAMQESLGCKIIPKKSAYNCWGLAVYTHHTQAYSSYEEGIEVASKTLSKYQKNGLITLEQIGSKWNPGNTNDWVGKVNYFMNQIENEPIIAYLTNL